MGDEKSNEAKAPCSTLETVKKALKFTFTPNFTVKLFSKDIDTQNNQYISKCTVDGEATLKVELAFQPDPDAEPESSLTLWTAFIENLKKQKEELLNPSMWKLGDPKLQMPELGGGAEHAAGETGAAADFRLVGVEADLGPFGKVSLEFDVFSYSDKKWSGPQITGELAQGVETQEFHPFAKWEATAASLEIALSIGVVPNWVNIGKYILEKGLKPLWNSLKEAGDAFAVEVGVDGVIAGAFIAGGALVLVASYEAIQDDDAVRGVTDNIEKWIEQAQTQYLQGLTTAFGTGITTGQYFTQGSKIRMKLLSNWDTWMQQKQDAAGVPSAQQITALIYEADNPSGARESPEGGAWVTAFINANAKSFKGDALADTAISCMKQIWETFARANPHDYSISNYSVPQKVFTIIASSKPAEWVTYYPGIAFPPPFGKGSDKPPFVDNFEYTQFYPNDSSAKSS